MDLRRLCPALALALAAPLAACASPGAAASVGPAARTEPLLDGRLLVGCWTTATWGFRLDSVPHPSVQGEPAARRALVSNASADVGTVYWRVPGPDRFEPRVDNLLHGAVYRFRVRGDTLIGREHGDTDIVPHDAPRMRYAAVRAWRRPCGRPADPAGR